MKILILSPHTDDAEIACGGTIAKWVEEGHFVFHHAFSTAEVSLLPGEDFSATTREFHHAQQVLGCEGSVGTFETRTFPEWRQDILDSILELSDSVRPELVVGPSVHDCHQDHQVVAEEMTRAFRRTTQILSYEHPRNDRGFSPHSWSILTHAQVLIKTKAIESYKSQLNKTHSFLDRKSIHAVLRYRGMQVNERYAEAFEVVRSRI